MKRFLSQPTLNSTQSKAVHVLLRVFDVFSPLSSRFRLLPAEPVREPSAPLLLELDDEDDELALSGTSTVTRSSAVSIGDALLSLSLSFDDYEAALRSS